MEYFDITSSILYSYEKRQSEYDRYTKCEREIKRPTNCDYGIFDTEIYVESYFSFVVVFSFFFTNLKKKGEKKHHDMIMMYRELHICVLNMWVYVCAVKCLWANLFATGKCLSKLKKIQFNQRM